MTACSLIDEFFLITKAGQSNLSSFQITKSTVLFHFVVIKEFVWSYFKYVKNSSYFTSKSDKISFGRATVSLASGEAARMTVYGEKSQKIATLLKKDAQI